MIQLRPYQTTIVGEARAQYAAGKTAVLVVSPTGSGKTYTFAHIAEAAASRGNRVLILEHRKELIRQASLSLGSLEAGHRIVAPRFILQHRSLAEPRPRREPGETDRLAVA